VAQSPRFQGKRLLQIAGLNIDISPQPGEAFPATHFVPWAAYVQDKAGRQRILEQSELLAVLADQSPDNPDQMDLEAAIRAMSEADRLGDSLHAAG
jgi:hypothetical protein